jgi:hypothetical protein
MLCLAVEKTGNANVFIQIVYYSFIYAFVFSLARIRGGRTELISEDSSSIAVQKQKHNNINN